MLLNCDHIVRPSPLLIITVLMPYLRAVAMIEDTLDGAKSKRYRHAARHLAECRSLVAAIGDFKQFETHEVFVARLRAGHSRKSGFWPLVAEAGAVKR